MADVSLFSDLDPTDGAHTWTVAELSAHIGRVVASALPGDVWVQGQIRNLSRAPNGHVYFQLVEPCDTGRAPRTQIAVTLLAPEKRHVNAQIKAAGGGVRMEDGIEVRIQGRVRWYEPRGTVQVRMAGIDPAYTLGRLQADRDAVLARLASDGLLDANRSHPIPLVPLRVGLVTSIGSAAHADVLAELTASGFSFTVRCADARTQGPDCAPSVTRALHLLGTGGLDGVDVILLVRGGGARTDLVGFDTDLVARAIAAAGVPVLTGIGHEIDRSIADEVAHTAHKTPTAAAAAVVEMVRSFLARVNDAAVAVHRDGHHAVVAATGRLDHRTLRIAQSSGRAMARHEVAMTSIAQAIARRSERGLAGAERSIANTTRVLTERSDRQLAHAARRIAAAAGVVSAHDPARALARGWTITTTADGAFVRGIDDVQLGATLLTRTAGGTIESTVTVARRDDDERSTERGA